MKVIKYKISTKVNYGTDEDPNIQDFINEKIVPYSLKAEEYAKEESYNGEITIENDGQPEPEPTELEQIRADIDFISVMTGVTL